ncbi:MULTISPECIES: D-ribose pyranase [Lactobacillus]|uniref:D-ribose pyranase n=1 Tax=Lactobacillus TaxID=1578 RepID=UPI001C6A7616|nr:MULTISPECIES: D-ribose pyranase [Lactobacillus]MCX8722077.1 D-ribose pyranase [Lactobacillus sp. B4010]MCX8723841.1 D-ribose pyranase [Lactobacillus sp. B4005]MCX8732715.1 D-ribose pyranase [Lactobacillus sp. B4015]MCX8734935.1 D-ribose pyranase [Lactobacillus sp. B4012]QYN57503.1 D-ribose pyranase [Lactobacillus panisapium]
MKKTGILNSDISRVVANMGHMDWLGIGDAGTPVPPETEKIDLAVKAGLPSFSVVLEEILKELSVQKIYVAEEIKSQNPEQLKNIIKILPNVEIEFIPHSQLKKNLTRAKAFIRTGEETPYSNVILESGVIF